jgi:DNA methyltransferase 1-associated protein 1
MTEFKNEARSDGLVLRHWHRTETANKAAKPDDTTIDVDEQTADGAQKEPKQYTFAKYNIKAQVPKEYTDEQYQRHLQSDDWSREETDYLMGLVEEYDLRWVIIADRYDYQPKISENSEANATALVTAKSVRTMEQMKARYYTVAANMLALEHPPSEMSEAEFALHEKMMKFDPDRERQRKELAALQLNRTADEVREEGILLEELKRIVTNEQNFIAERRELYSRLDVPYHVSNTTMYQSSQGLSQLLSTLLQADKSKKRRSILGPESIPSPAGQTPSQTLPNGARDSQVETPTTALNKKGSAAAAAASAAATPTQPTLRTLTKEEEQRYGVQHHDRVTPGVHFRNDKATKLTQAKSNIQTQKLAAALTELDIPLRLLMPTEKVCKEFERLIHQVNTLLDARKVAEKVESEIRVLEAAREERQKKEREANPTAAATTNEAGTDQAEKQIKLESVEDQPQSQEGAATADYEETETNQQNDAAASNTAEASTAGNKHKRSASVLSAQSDKSSKRQRK